MPEHAGGVRCRQPIGGRADLTFEVVPSKQGSIVSNECDRPTVALDGCHGLRRAGEWIDPVAAGVHVDPRPRNRTQRRAERRPAIDQARLPTSRPADAAPSSSASRATDRRCAISRSTVSRSPAARATSAAALASKSARNARRSGSSAGSAISAAA